jgi:hypothetical protein
MHLHGNANRHIRQNVRCNAAMQISYNTAVIPAERLRRYRERCSPFFTASLEGWATSAKRPSFETPRKRAAPQDDG